MSAIFVSGTGTDVGKTFVAAGLIRALRRQGGTVDALKPIVTGFDPAASGDSDPARLLAALARPATSETIARLSPWRFRAPLSPDMAARAEGRRLDLDAVISFCRKEVVRSSGLLLIEGVGGIMAPLDERATVLDWMAALRLPVVLVAGTYLGTLSHTLSALDVLARRGLTVRALVVSESAGATVALHDTVATLTNFTGDTPLMALPRLSGTDAENPAFARLVGRIGYPATTPPLPHLG